MKTKLNSWQITLLSIFTIIFAAIISIFYLKAEPIDEEETPEELVDNWDLDIVFFDSFVDSGIIKDDGTYNQLQCNTPLTEINWDASDNGYGQGETRVIVVQVNYKNTNAITTYNVGDLKITIPNLIASGSKRVYNSETKQYEYVSYGCGNANWSKSVLVGANDSTHTGYDWNYSSKEENYIFTNAITIEEKANFEGSIQIVYTITPLAELAENTPYVERYEDKCTHSYNLNIDALLEYNKILEDSTTQKIQINSNELNFNYTRTYTHPWKKVNYGLTKSAYALTALDGLTLSPENYYFVKYNFEFTDIPYWSHRNDYPYIYASEYKLIDTFPSECIVYNENFQLLTGTEQPNGTKAYQLVARIKDPRSNTNDDNIFYVAYPKSSFNENNNNLIITNTGYVYGTYATETEETLLCQDDIIINLADFDFSYPDQLYSIYKGMSKSYRGIMYSDYLLKPNFYHSCYYCNRGSGHITTGIRCNLTINTFYTGTPMTVRFGDDLLYITAENGNYRKLQENEYVFDYIYLPELKNKNNISINYDKYPSSLYVKYANTDDFVFYMDLSSKKKEDIIDFEVNEKIVAFYIQIENLTESLVASRASGSGVSDRRGSIGIHIKPTNDILAAGKIYNFAFLEVFFKDTNGNLILQNETELSNYATLTTQDNIAEYDIETYGHYMQRDEDFWEYIDGNTIPIYDYIQALKTNGSLKQDAENELFSLTNNKIGFYLLPQETNFDLDIDYMNHIYWENNPKKITTFKTYDLLPQGMNLTSTKEEILNSINISDANYYNCFYNSNKTQAFSSSTELLNFIKTHSSINIIENWKNTGRTKIEWFVDFSEFPLLMFGYRSPQFYINFNSAISYDSYLEYGQTWKNITYSESFFLNNEKMANKSSLKDEGKNDKEATDINENNDTTETLSSANSTTTINSVVSTHQDVTIFVKTDYNYFMTKIADASCSSEYQYKLRVRSGNNKITNLILYCNLEEAQTGKTRWKGQFLGFDTSYAQNKGYNVKTYYSENPEAGNLYNENEIINSDWKEYSFYSPAIYAQGLEVTFNNQFATEAANWDYLEIYYILNGTTYKLGKWGGTDLAGKTIQIPTNDFYLYWHTDNSKSNFYGFSIDSITHTNISNTNTTKGTIPSYTIDEISGNNYPDSAFDSYTHGNYGNSVNKIWHYTYDGEKELIQEATQQTDNSKVKSLAFEYLDSNGNTAILPANSISYVLINMKAPTDENIKTLARNACRTQWNALDEFGIPVQGITGINSNVVKVALPNSVKTDDVPSISLNFIKEITGSDEDFNNLLLNKTDEQIFAIRLTSLTANDDGSYNQITGLLSSTQGLSITNIPIGTYLLEELGDNYFNFVEFSENNEEEIIINGVTFEQTEQGYIITVSENLSETIEFNIKVTNEIEDERFFEDKSSKENLFLKNKIEEGIPS